jgi:Ornithine cyclodeaminase/mu-crystallin family
VVGGSAWWNVTMLDDLFDFEEIRVTSRRPESRERFAARLAEELGKPVRAVATPAEAGPLGALRRHVDSGRLSRAGPTSMPSRPPLKYARRACEGLLRIRCW